MSLMFREMFTCPRCGHKEVHDRRHTSQGKVVQTLCYYCWKVSKVLVGPPIKTAAEIAAEKDATLRDQAALIERLRTVVIDLIGHDDEWWSLALKKSIADLHPGDLGEETQQ